MKIYKHKRAFGNTTVFHDACRKGRSFSRKYAELIFSDRDGFQFIAKTRKASSEDFRVDKTLITLGNM